MRSPVRRPALRSVQADKVTAAVVRRAASEAAEVVIYDGEEPVARVVPLSIELAAKEAYFVHHPHPAEECLYTCWRHPRQPQLVP